MRNERSRENREEKERKIQNRKILRNEEKGKGK